MITRARALWLTIAPYARPALAVAAVGWGLATLGRELAERRELLALIDAEVATRSGDLRTLAADLVAASAQLQHLRRPAADPEERADEGEVDTPAEPVATGNDVWIDDELNGESRTEPAAA